MKVLERGARYISVVMFLSFLAACDGDDDHPRRADPEPNIAEVAAANGSFTTLITALEAAGLDATLADEDATFTVFAPTDDAFAKLGTDTINSLLADTDTLSDILLYHVVAEQEIDADAAAAAVGMTLDMANGDDAAVSQVGDALYVNLSQVIDTNISASNGIIHVLDTVLIPPVERGTPTDNIVETAVNAGNFGTLVTALQAAGLDTTLADENETFTVFAPTDAAFGLIPQATLDALLADPMGDLTAILLDHVIQGAEVNSIGAFAAAGTDVSTLGGDIPISINENNQLTVGGSVVSMTDIYTTNGVIHVIDAVILQ